MIKFKIKSIVSIILCVVLVSSILGGCSWFSRKQSQQEQETQGQVQEEQQTQEQPQDQQQTQEQPQDQQQTQEQPQDQQQTQEQPQDQQQTQEQPQDQQQTQEQPQDQQQTQEQPQDQQSQTTTSQQQNQPTTSQPTTSQPTTSQPTTSQPTTSQPTTSKPTTSQPTTSKPTTSQPTTSKPTTSQPTTSKPTTSQPTTSKPTTSQPTTSQPVKITYWAATSPETPADDPENLECFKEVERKVGVDIEWIHIPKGTESEQFQLMIASNNLPDVIFYEWLSYGPDVAMEGDIIIPLDDIIAKYAPNLSKYLKQNPDVAKDMKSDSGHYYCFPYLRGKEMWDRLTNGLYMRKDWLDELGLKAPETIDEWYTALKAFKEQRGATIPFGIDFGRIGFITSAWGFNGTGFVVDKGKIVYAPIQPQFKQVLETLNKWIKEGLLKLDPTNLKTEIIAGRCGAWQASPGSYVNEGKAANPKFEIVALKNPVLQKGATPYIFPRWPYTGRGAAITTACAKSKYEAVARWLDYAYSWEGYLWDNFGKEGVHYTWVNGKIMPTDIVYNPPAGLTTGQFNRRNFRPKNAPGPYMTGDTIKYLHIDALKKDPNYPYKKQAVTAWGTGDPSRTLPNITLSPEENKQLQNYSQLWTYVSDMIRKFINGQESLDNFDKFVAEAKRLGVMDVIKIYQRAYDRYKSR